MSKRLFKFVLLAVAVAALQGCVAIPPLVQVEHKESSTDLKRRLDSIEQRLNRIEEKLDKK
jgi:starvation-inducible outer membrane lipoprotein